MYIYIQKEYIYIYSKRFEGPVLNCRGRTKQTGVNTNGLVIDEIWNNTSVIFQIFFQMLQNRNRPVLVKVP